MGQLRHRGDERGGRRNRAGRSGRDHRAGTAGKPLRLGLDQRVAARRRFDHAALGEDFRPGRAGNLEERKRELPVFVEVVRHQVVETIEGDAARGHVIDETAEVIGERQRGRRMIGDERRLAGVLGSELLGPSQHQPREQKPPLDPAQRRRQIKFLGQIERLRPDGAGRGLIKQNLVLVHIPDGNDARQDRGLQAAHVEKCVARQATGPAGGQIDGSAGERERILRQILRQARHQGAIHERLDQGRQKRRRSRDGEDARRVEHGVMRSIRWRGGYRIIHGSCPGRGAARSSCGAVHRRAGIVPNAGVWNGPGSRPGQV